MSNTINEAMANTFMLVTVNTRKWTAQGVDRSESDELTRSKNAVAGAAKVVKSLMIGADRELKECNSAYDAIRTHLYANTMPYVTSSGGNNKGPRMIASVNTPEFLVEHKKLVDTAKDALEALLQAYPARVQEAVQNQGDMGKAVEYPTVEDIRGMFSCDIAVQPMPASSDFSRGMIPSKVAEFLGDRMERQQEQAMSNAMDDLRNKLLVEVKRIAEQLGKVSREEKTRLYDSLISNTRNLTGILRSAQVKENKELDSLISRIESELCTYDTSQYKDNPTLAKKTAASAIDIGKLIDDMEFF